MPLFTDHLVNRSSNLFDERSQTATVSDNVDRLLRLAFTGLRGAFHPETNLCGIRKGIELCRLRSPLRFASNRSVSDRNRLQIESHRYVLPIEVVGSESLDRLGSRDSLQ